MLRIASLTTKLIGPVSLTVNPGECAAITGASGSGKSLMLRAIADLDPNTGQVHLGQLDRDRIPAWQWRRQVAMVPAETGWWADQVRDHFAPEFDPVPLLSALGMKQALDWSVSRLSSGERQRLGLVRALCRHPQAVLLDEPTAALDPEATERVEAVIRGIIGRGVPAIVITHDAAQAGRLGARHYRMHNGQLDPETPT